MSAWYQKNRPAARRSFIFYSATAGWPGVGYPSVNLHEYPHLEGGVPFSLYYERKLNSLVSFGIKSQAYIIVSVGSFESISLNPYFKANFWFVINTKKILLRNKLLVIVVFEKFISLFLKSYTNHPATQKIPYYYGCSAFGFKIAWTNWLIIAVGIRKFGIMARHAFFLIL